MYHSALSLLEKWLKQAVTVEELCRLESIAPGDRNIVASSAPSPLCLAESLRQIFSTALYVCWEPLVSFATGASVLCRHEELAAEMG